MNNNNLTRNNLHPSYGSHQWATDMLNCITGCKHDCKYCYSKEIAEKVGIKKACLHKFRHTYATHLVQKGVGLEQIQKLLGHSSIQETLVYAHVKPEGLHPEVSVLDDLNTFDDKEKIDVY